ncbi:hypothetical protein MNBD_GAMMA22-994 [hydrothermal vent metagenome]|uniref:HTH tetR-type domain-containing protein n=1 Tax=hydrothermal vent metagenome TaxID=652676 RepID=A0A3B1ALX3_9ZZZZ
MTSRETTEQQRNQMIIAIDILLYQKGFNNMSFSDIAEATGLSKGNLYYYFKTKEDLLQVIIEHRVNAMKLMLNDWQLKFKTPLERLQRYAQIPVNESTNVIHYGCPMGSLNTELAKSQPELQKISKQQFDVFKQWLKKQMRLMLPNENSEHLAMRLLVRTQGIAIMSQTFNDKNLILREVEDTKRWLNHISKQ